MAISDTQSLPLSLAMAIVDQSATVRGSPGLKRSPPRAQPLSDRAQQRLMRQAVIQAELEAEEREALKMTPVSRLPYRLPFHPPSRLATVLPVTSYALGRAQDSSGLREVCQDRVH